MTVASVVIPHYGKDELLNACLAALWRSTDMTTVQLIIHDNRHENIGFAAGCNEGYRRSTGDPVIFLNNDTEPNNGWLDPLVEALDDPKVGIAGSKLVYPNGEIQHAGVDVFYVGQTLTAAHSDPSLADVRREVPAVTGACLAIRRECFDQCDGFDVGYWNGYDDVDLCLTAGSLGWRVCYEPASVVMHHESASGPERWSRVNENVQRLQDKWAVKLRAVGTGVG